MKYLANLFSALSKTKKMTSMIKKGVTVGLFMFVSSPLLAYEIGASCRESTQNWLRLFGTCDNDGYLQGRGAALMGDLAVFGDFTKGVPNGMQHVVLVQGNSIASQAAVKDFSEKTLKRIGKMNGAYHERSGGICKVNFANGQPADNVLHCDGIDAKAKSGTVKLTLNNGRVVLSLGGADISGLHSHGKLSLLDLDPYNATPVELKGTASSVTFGQNANQKGAKFFVESFSGIASFPPTGNRKTTHSIKGSFDYADGRINVRYVNATDEPATPANEDIKYDIEVHGKKFKAAFFKPLFDEYLLAQYLKIDNEVEFDGSGFELCLNRGWRADEKSQFDSSGAVVISFKTNGYNNSRELVIVPKCGKITDKTGRSYSGFFDKQGRPAAM